MRNEMEVIWMERVNVDETVCIRCGKKIGLNVLMTSDDGETWYHYYDCLRDDEAGE